MLAEKPADKVPALKSIRGGAATGEADKSRQGFSYGNRGQGPAKSEEKAAKAPEVVTTAPPMPAPAAVDSLASEDSKKVAPAGEPRNVADRRVMARDVAGAKNLADLEQKVKGQPVGRAAVPAGTERRHRARGSTGFPRPGGCHGRTAGCWSDASGDAKKAMRSSRSLDLAKVPMKEGKAGNAAREGRTNGGICTGSSFVGGSRETLCKRNKQAGSECPRGRVREES